MHKLPLHPEIDPEGVAGCSNTYTTAYVWGCPPGESEELAKFCYLHAGLPHPEKIWW